MLFALFPRFPRMTGCGMPNETIKGYFVYRVLFFLSVTMRLLNCDFIARLKMPKKISIQITVHFGEKFKLSL